VSESNETVEDELTKMRVFKYPAMSVSLGKRDAHTHTHTHAHTHTHSHTHTHTRTRTHTMIYDVFVCVGQKFKLEVEPGTFTNSEIVVLLGENGMCVFLFIPHTHAHTHTPTHTHIHTYIHTHTRTHARGSFVCNFNCF